MTERLADFLIIGAMKSGTTTLYRDLLTHSRIYFPLNKEPDHLTSDAVLSPAGKAAYAAHFERARADELCGDASTAYTKLPDYPGVPSRAVRVLPDGFKAIYVVREPVSRIISQHHHEYTAGRMGANIDHAIGEHTRLIDYSRYAMQVEPWIDAIGRDRVRIVVFEDYIADRRGTVRDLCSFLGLTPEPEKIETDRVFNKGEGKAIAVGGWARIMTAGWYRSLIRPILPVSVRERLRERLLPKAPPRPAPPSAETVRTIVEAVREDEVRLREIMQRGDPIWDWPTVLEKYGVDTDDSTQHVTTASQDAQP